MIDRSQIEDKPYLKLEECVHGRIYRISSRNLKIGVYNEAVRGFTGIRVKFGSRYLFTEYHWDTGSPHGTVKPLFELDRESPVENPSESSSDLFKRLEDIESKMNFDMEYVG